MKTLVITFLTGLFAISTINAQNKLDNYVIPNMGDTIYGKYDESVNLNGVFNVLFIDEKGTKITYKPGELIGFRKDNIDYVDREIRTLGRIDHAYLKLVVKGYVSVYMSILIGDGGPGVVQLEEKYYLEKNGFTEKVDVVGFASKMKKYFADDPEIVSKLKSRVYQYANTPAMVRAYNNKKAE